MIEKVLTLMLFLVGGTFASVLAEGWPRFGILLLGLGVTLEHLIARSVVDE